uniref:Putative very-long-chain acyl-coa dehydrogenase n=1 Tax=Amblyomma cajennense TaxID=34607 RepID=A0A023FGS6_AMBCJ
MQSGADTLEYCVKRLKHIVEIVLQNYGKEVIEHQVVLSHLADMAMQVYAMACVLARASRSYCIGLPNAEREVDIALCFCDDAKKKVKHCEDEIIDEMENMTHVRKRLIADKVFEDKAYFPVHPLMRN